MLRPSGDRARTDRRDATFLARMLAVGNIAGVAMPTEAMEAARDLARAREDCRHDLMRARHLLPEFLLRKGIVHPGKTAWTKAHREWLGRPGFADPCERLVFGDSASLGFTRLTNTLPNPTSANAPAKPA